MYKCEFCDTEYQLKEQAQNCCSVFSLNPQTTKQQFIEQFMGLQKDLGIKSLANTQFKGIASSQTIAEYIWIKFKQKKSLTLKQFQDFLNQLIVEFTLSGLCDKKLMQIAGIGDSGQVMYKLTQQGKKIAKEINKEN